MQRTTALAAMIAGLLIAPIMATPAAAQNNAAIQDHDVLITYPLVLFQGPALNEPVSTTCTVTPGNWQSAINHSTVTIQFWADSTCTIPTVRMKPGESVPVRLPGVHNMYTASW